YILLQGFDSAPVVSQKRPEIPKVKQDEQPIPVAIFQIEDSDLLNFMSGGLTGPRGIVSGKIKIAGAIELAEQLEEIFRKAKGAEKTLAYLEHKRGKSEKAKARLATPAPTQSKVQSLARRYSAMAKQAATDGSTVHQDKPKPVVIGKVSNIINKTKDSAPVAAVATATVAATTVKTPEVVKEQEEPSEEKEVQEEVVEQATVQEPMSEASDIADKVQEIDLEEAVKKEEEQEYEISEEPEEVVLPEVKEETVVAPEEKKEEEPVKAEEEHKEEAPVAEQPAPVVEEAEQVEEAPVAQEQPQEQEKEQEQEIEPEVTKIAEIETPASVESAVDETKLVEA
ncbi:hypothetical protein BGZ52_001151, partial [Haplosporangium bisporale]